MNELDTNPFIAVDAALRSYLVDIGRIDAAQAAAGPFARPVASVVEESNGCRHEFIEYVGIREAYSYCTKCDLKK